MSKFTPSLESALRQKLKGLRGFPSANSQTPQRASHRDPRPSPMNWQGDGIDHINIWRQGGTELGRVLTHNAKIPFRHHIFGRFSCVESFWHYVRSEEHDDRIRAMSGKALQQFAHMLTKTNVPNFRAIIMDANWQKVKQYPEIKQALIESTLPFDCYYVYKRENSIPIRTNFASWVIDGFEEIRRALKEGREPDFTFLRDEQEHTDMYTELLSVMQKRNMTIPKSREEEEEEFVPGQDDDDGATPKEQPAAA